ncbi:hypothetical protein [Dietzia lutea]|nr:hypothetical protein [Dietzia lutea]
MAASLIETMAAEFEPEKYEDDYQTQFKELIETKAAGGEAFTVEVKDTLGDDEDDDEDSGSAKKIASKKGGSSSAKKSTARKAPA